MTAIQIIRRLVEDEFKKVKKFKIVNKTKGKTDRENKEHAFPGYADLHRLGVGIISDDQGVELDEENEKKKNCTKGSPYHDNKGRFVNPDKEGGSWSVANKSGKTGCKKGKARRPSGRQEKFTKLPCGRLDVDNPNRKAKNLCKGGKVEEVSGWEDKYKVFVDGIIEGTVEEEEFNISDEHIVLPHDPYEQAKKQQELEVIIKKLQSQLQKNKSSKADCGLSFADAKQIIIGLKLAQKGSTPEQERVKSLEQS